MSTEVNTPAAPTPVVTPPILALLVGEAISKFGTQMTWLALPWFVLLTTGSAQRMTLLVAAQTAAYLVFGLPSSRVLVHLGARRTLLLSDGLRGPVMTTVPILHWTGHLSYSLLVGFAFAVAALGTPYPAAQRLVLPELLGEHGESIAKANALFQISSRTAFLMGPVLGGLAIALVGAPDVLLVDGATFGVSFLLIAFLVDTGARPGRSRKPTVSTRATRDALSFIWEDSLLRGWLVSITVIEACFPIIFIGIPLMVFRYYGAQAALAGVLAGAFGAGAAVGNAISFRVLSRKASPNRVAVSLAAQTGGLIWIALPVPYWMGLVGLAVSGLGNGIANPVILSVITLKPPANMRPHILTVLYTASQLAVPIGLVCAGWVFATWGVRPGIAVAVVLEGLAATLLVYSARRSRASIERFAGAASSARTSGIP